MNIIEYKLTVTCRNIDSTDELTHVDDTEKELIYRGNENVIIRERPDKDPLADEKTILIPRHILEKFLEMINE